MKALLRSLIAAIVRPLMSIVEDELAERTGRHAAERKKRLLHRLQDCGTGVRLNGDIVVSEPRACVLGNNVHIGDNAFLRSNGGITIGDNTHISRNFLAYTQNHNFQGEALPYDAELIDKPVAIGRNVWIGMNVSIIPGVRIGDGAIVGMGSVVTKDVAPGSIVGGAPASVIAARDQAHYANLVANKKFGGVNGHVTHRPPPAPWPHADQQGDNLFFVLTTGRSGSQSVARTLDSHSRIICRHEPRWQMIRLSTELAHGIKDRATVKAELEDIFLTSATYDPAFIHGESDQKYFNLVPLLHEILPRAKFIWLVRDGRDVVASTYARGWFSDDEYQADAGFSDLKTWQQYRIHGGKCGVMPATTWASMSTFARNCWYWAYVNQTIESSLEAIPPAQSIRFSLSELNRDVTPLTEFLNAPPEAISPRHANRAKVGQKPAHWQAWSAEQHEEFETYCGPGMTRWLA